MANTLRYITHPTVKIDPAAPVPEWGLNEAGLEQVRGLLRQPWMSGIGRIISSGETKALQTAEALASHLGLAVETRRSTGENDRSSTGFVPPEQFELLANAFFADPDISIQGWERAIDAQTRIVSSLDDLLDPTATSDVAIIGHGGVGTLWYCHLTGQAIDRIHDQPGQGHYFSVDLGSSSVLHTWLPVSPSSE